MLFRKDIDPRCEYCRHGSPIGEDEIVCVKRGITTRDARCPRFKYDAVKRAPETRSPMPKTKLTKEDFEL
ncbi:MAG: hypothetical protein LBH17_08350 [Oscillospiraceae bacterium]|jgi:hypothetical protein|nr:hypothetical protein [Oscillospiraceae bacterium]